MKRKIGSYDTYVMYEEECYKNELLTKENKYLKIEVESLNNKLDYLRKSYDNKLNKEIEKNTKALIEEKEQLENELKNANDEIMRLKKELENKISIEIDKDYEIDKLNCQLNKDSTNSSIPTSKELIKKKKTAYC